MPSRSSRKVSFSFLVVLLAAALVPAQDIPVRNWEVPRGDLGKEAVVPPNPFAAISPPCRLSDSRVTSGGPGPIPGSGTRDYDFIPGGSAACGALPANVVALSVYFTVVNPLGPGFLFAFPTGSPPGTPTSIINYNGTPGELRNNAAILPVNPASGSFTVGTGVSGTDLIIDINGIFYNDIVSGQRLFIAANINGTAAIVGQNTATANNSSGVAGAADGGFVHGVQGVIGPAVTSGASGVYGLNTSTVGGTFGVIGVISAISPGPSEAAVRGLNGGTNGNGSGVWGSHEGGGYGVFGTSDTGPGVYGFSTSGFGVRADTSGTAAGDAGVRGQDGTGNVSGGTSQPSAGVLGLSEDGRGVMGIVDSPTGEGVTGYMFNSAGVFQTAGFLGYSTSAGVHSIGDITVISGVKSFIEPHPTDASKVIRFITLEGDEPGTYFRGKSKFERGLASITVPEAFRIVTDSEGLTIQVTPVGEMASVAVVRLDLDGIVVKGSRNVEFYYLVNGVRRAYKGLNALAENEKFFVPEGPDALLPVRLSADEKSRLISNGTYNPDGTVNMETARKLGWDKGWKKPKSAE